MCYFISSNTQYVFKLNVQVVICIYTTYTILTDLCDEIIDMNCQYCSIVYIYHYN